MKKDKIQDLIGEVDIDEFNDALDMLPDEFQGKPLKANVRKYFKMDGTAKTKKQVGQEWKDTQTFIRRRVRGQIHVNRIKKHRDAHVQLITEKKTKTHKVERYGVISERKKGKDDE